jgi:hypothetical protein
MMDKDTGRFIAINLTDDEWHALRSVTPDPVAWIRSQIHNLLDQSGIRPALQNVDLRPDSMPALELAD